MAAAMPPEIHREFDIMSCSYGYWAQVGDWAAIGGFDGESGLAKIRLNHYLHDGNATYRTSAFGVQPCVLSMIDTGRYAAMMAKAHEIEEPDWLAPALKEIVSCLSSDWSRTR